jgi:hypothetical protein
MTSKENHLRKIREHLDEIKDAIDEGIENKPITIGFHCSACAIELLELFLHQINKIQMGKVLEHNWFKRPSPEQKKEALVDRKIGVEFSGRKEIYELIYTIEDHRNNLIYGNPNKTEIEKVINAFNKLKGFIIEKLQQKGVEIEK